MRYIKTIHTLYIYMYNNIIALTVDEEKLFFVKIFMSL